MKCDVLVVAAHPDDAELTCGGSIKKLTNSGKKVVVVDCTKGEMGTRGTLEIRQEEAKKAAAILGLADRINLGMPDGAIEHSQENIRKVAGVIRQFQPTILLIPPPKERHPDHVAVHHLCMAANFVAGLEKANLDGEHEAFERHRARSICCFQHHFDFPTLPTFYVDVSDTFQDKLESIRAYGSQFHTNAVQPKGQSETFISRPEFLEEIEARARHYGSQIGVKYAEAFWTDQAVGLNSLTVLL